MVDTTSGLIPVNTGFNLEVLPSLNTCNQGRAIVLKLIYNNLNNLTIWFYKVSYYDYNSNELHYRLILISLQNIKGSS